MYSKYNKWESNDCVEDTGGWVGAVITQQLIVQSDRVRMYREIVAGSSNNTQVK